MDFTAISSYTGAVLYTGTADDPFALAQDGVAILDGVKVENTNAYWSGTGFVDVPDAPTPNHVWDWPTKQWVGNTATAAASRMKDVEKQAATRIVAPITFNDAPFDADAIARGRITGTIARVNRDGDLPKDWIGWRDHANNQHWATDTPSFVATELGQLSRAIEDREQAILIAAWTHKYHIGVLEQAADLDGLLAYDVTTGWPT